MTCCLTIPNYYLNQCWLFINEVLRHSHKCTDARPGARPTNGISIEFEIRPTFAVLWFECAQPITTKFCTPHDGVTVGREVCATLLWSVEYVMNKSITAFHWISVYQSLTLTKLQLQSHPLIGYRTSDFFVENSESVMLFQAGVGLPIITLKAHERNGLTVGMMMYPDHLQARSVDIPSIGISEGNLGFPSIILRIVEDMVCIW